MVFLNVCFHSIAIVDVCIARVDESIVELGKNNLGLFLIFWIQIEVIQPMTCGLAGLKKVGLHKLGLDSVRWHHWANPSNKLPRNSYSSVPLVVSTPMISLFSNN